MRTAEVERIKLTANLLNSMASGIVLAALVGPFIGVGLGTLQLANPLNVAAFSIFGLMLAIVLHLLARRVLLQLRD
ncbi:MAG: hypothetical protein P4M09_27005 [Devosia sp.]|nr:hypothetical protein [Devosia sp.]